MKRNDAIDIINILKDTYPAAQCSLDFKTPFEMTVAVMLSAQCTDERVNKTTPLLFENYGTPESICKMDIEELEKLGVDVVKDNLTETQKTYVRHNAQKLAKIIIETVMERKMLYDRNKILEYIYLCKKIKTRDN